MNTSILSQYRKWIIKHYNFMTPQIVSVKSIDEWIIELSKGVGIDRKEIYGVTILWYDGDTFKSTNAYSQLNKCFNDLREAKKHFRLVQLQVYKSR